MDGSAHSRPGATRFPFYRGTARLFRLSENSEGSDERAARVSGVRGGERAVGTEGEPGEAFADATVRGGVWVELVG